MTHHAAAPLWGQILILVFAPPTMSCIFWVMSRGWARTVQGTRVSGETKGRQWSEFWALLIVL
jgi:hypothetical protein